jgi:hypothetical protein
MGKFVNAKDCSLQVVNYRKNSPVIQITMSMQYSCLDILEILKMYTGYNENADFDFYNVYNKEYFSTKYGHKNFDDVTIGDFQGISPEVICSFGPFKIKYSFRRHQKWSKVYPLAYQAYGNFPNEKEYNKLDNVSYDKLAEYLKKNSTERFMATSALPLYKEDYLKEFNEKLKEYFRNKYKISDEIYETTWNSNKLIRK